LFPVDCPLAAVDCPLAAVDCPLAAVDCPLAAVDCPLAAVDCPLAAVDCPLAAVDCPLAAVDCPLAAVDCPLAAVDCPLAAVDCPLAAVDCPLAAVDCPPDVDCPPVVDWAVLERVDDGLPVLSRPQQGPPEVNTFNVDVVTTEPAAVEAEVEVAPPGIGVALPVVRKEPSPVIIAASVMVPLVKVDARVVAAGGFAQPGAVPWQSSPVSKRFGHGMPPV